MKKIIAGVSSLLVLAFIVFLTVSARDKDKGSAKSKVEVTKEYSQCPSATACKGHSGSAAVSCDPAKCKEGKCDPTKCKAGMCDPATCSAHKEGAQKESHNCIQTAACPGTCHSKDAVVK